MLRTVFERSASLGAVFAAALSAIACGSGESPKNLLQPGQTLTVAGASGHATGQISASGDIAEGRNAFAVKLDPPSTQIASASVIMPSMGHAAPAPDVAESGETYQLTNVIFSMPGVWEVTLDLGVGSATDEIQFTVDVP
jgi:hypothetical protein